MKNTNGRRLAYDRRWLENSAVNSYTTPIGISIGGSRSQTWHIPFLETVPVIRINCLILFTLLVVGCSSSEEPPTLSSSSDSQETSGVVLMRYKPGSESTTQREEGFLAELAENYPDIQVISSDQYGMTTTETSLNMSSQLLIKFQDRMTGVFAVCEPNADGMLTALQDKELAGNIKFVGFDPNERMVGALADGHMHGIVLQDPVTMGYLSVKTMVAHLDGQPVEKRISTGENCATPANMTSEKMKSLLHPPQFSGGAYQPDEAKYRLAVIPKGTTHEFWLSVRFGAEKAAKELGNVEVIWNGPLNEGNVEEQISIVETMVSKGVDGICLAPNDSQGLASVTKNAHEKSVPVVIFDSGIELDPSEYVSYVATDNFNGGRLAGKCLAEALQQ